MKTHLNLPTTDLSQSVAFYGTLLGIKPLKVYHDYALFVSEDPGLELALSVAGSVKHGESTHYGLAVESVPAVENAVERLRSAGLVADVQLDDVCCYAKQTKVWTADPDGRRWEIYTVLEETEVRDNDATQCCAAEQSDDSCCAA
ncbi:MAG: VOC family protein [Candidatus Eremiobacteraeota bacterium]|nr:VOC family protein [Candidatus Eremiobacteraeota bacterium]